MSLSSRIVAFVLTLAVIAVGPVAAHVELDAMAVAQMDADTSAVPGQPAAAAESCNKTESSAECHLNVVLSDAYRVAAPGGVAPDAVSEPAGEALHGPGFHPPPPRI